jgi:hypothetical protein
MQRNILDLKNKLPHRPALPPKRDRLFSQEIRGSIPPGGGIQGEVYKEKYKTKFYE